MAKGKRKSDIGTFTEYKKRNGDISHNFAVSVDNTIYRGSYLQKQGTSRQEALKSRQQEVLKKIDEVRELGKVRQEKRSKMTFREHGSLYIRDIKSITHKASMQDKLNDICSFSDIGDMPLLLIKQPEIRAILRYLNEKVIVDRSAVLVKPLAEVMKGTKQKDICQKARISNTTLHFALTGRVISWKSAEAISKALNINPREYFKEITSDPKGYAPNTKLGYKRFLNAVFNRALKDGDIKENPVPKVFDKNAIPKEKRVKKILGEIEAKQLAEALAREPLNKQVAISLSLYGAMRKCEACGLEWKDIDFANGTIHLKRNSIYTRGYGVHTTSTLKNGSDRKIQPPKELLNLLKLYKQHQDIERERLGTLWQDSDRVVVNAMGKPINPSSLTDWLKAILRKNNMKVVDCHSLRHSCIVVLLRNMYKVKGMSIGIVSAYAGHSSPSITMDIYEKYLTEDEGKAGACLDGIFGTEAPKPPQPDNVVMLNKVC